MGRPIPRGVSGSALQLRGDRTSRVLQGRRSAPAAKAAPAMRSVAKSVRLWRLLPSKNQLLSWSAPYLVNFLNLLWALLKIVSPHDPLGLKKLIIS